MRRSRLLLLPLMAMLPLLVDCASVSKAPEEDSAAAKAFETSDDRGAVYLYRTGRAIGAAGTTGVRVNSQEAGGLGPGSFFRWELAPGKYTFLSSTGESSATVALDVEAGKLYFIEQVARIGLNEGRVTMKQVDEDKGKSALKNLTMAVSAYLPE